VKIHDDDKRTSRDLREEKKVKKERKINHNEEYSVEERKSNKIIEHIIFVFDVSLSVHHCRSVEKKTN